MVRERCRGEHWSQAGCRNSAEGAHCRRCAEQAVPVQISLRMVANLESVCSSEVTFRMFLADAVTACATKSGSLQL